MIERYTTEEMAAVFSTETKLATWTRIEVLACEARHQFGQIDDDDMAALRRMKPPSVHRVAELERHTHHDVVAFLLALEESVDSPASRHIHRGMTSSDIVDTASAVALSEAARVLIGAVDKLAVTLRRRCLEWWEVPCVGRTHGQHAEPTTFGYKMASHLFAVHRARERLSRARDSVAAGTVSGAVGTYMLVDPRVEEYICSALGLAHETIPTQVVGRDRHAELLCALALLGCTVERIGLEVRHLQRTEVAEAFEPHGERQVGSSAMPHKRNPTDSERICGLARLLRAYSSTGLENVALWHERDISHSSVERVAIPDAFHVAHYQVRSATQIMAGLEIDSDQMRRSIIDSYSRVTSSVALEQAIQQGLSRTDAASLAQQLAEPASRRGDDAEVADHFGIDIPSESEFLNQLLERLRGSRNAVERLGHPDESGSSRVPGTE